MVYLAVPAHPDRQDLHPHSNLTSRKLELFWHEVQDRAQPSHSGSQQYPASIFLAPALSCAHQLLHSIDEVLHSFIVIELPLFLSLMAIAFNVDALIVGPLLLVASAGHRDADVLRR